MAAADEAPFDFVKRSRPNDHEHNSRCRHPQVVDDLSREACATSQLLYSVTASLQRFTGSGLSGLLRQAKTTVAQALVPPEFATGAMTGLKQALSRILQVPVSFVEFAMDKRSSYTNDQLNERLEAGFDTARRSRSDKYNRLVPYNFIHNLGDSPDYCMLVEPNKNQRTAWKGKAWELAGEHMVLTCQPHLRRGLVSAIVQDYRDSETCRQ
jgi:hypothetical protein